MLLVETKKKELVRQFFNMWQTEVKRTFLVCFVVLLCQRVCFDEVNFSARFST